MKKNDAVIPIEYGTSLSPDNAESFFEAAEKIQNEYLSLLSCEKCEIQEAAKAFFSDLILILQEYLEGRLILAFIMFNALMDSIADNDTTIARRTLLTSKKNSPVFPKKWLKPGVMVPDDYYTSIIKKESITYRAREDSEDKFKMPTKEDMFHVPFHLRGKVGNERYSVSGLPCLYVGDSLYACWLELGGPDASSFNCALVRVIKDLQVFDMAKLADSYRKYKSDSGTFKEKLFLIVIPLMLLSSFKVRDKSAIFKPEYVIPQLLTQWLIEKFHLNRGKTNLIGVRYYTNATKVDFEGPTTLYVNYAFPVLSSSKSGSCEGLNEYFNVEKILAGRFFQYSGEANFAAIKVKNQKQMAEDERVVLDPTGDFPCYYYQTLFGVMESVLKGDRPSRQVPRYVFTDSDEKSLRLAISSGGAYELGPIFGEIKKAVDSSLDAERKEKDVDLATDMATHHLAKSGQSKVDKQRALFRIRDVYEKVFLNYIKSRPKSDKSTTLNQLGNVFAIVAMYLIDKQLDMSLTKEPWQRDLWAHVIRNATTPAEGVDWGMLGAFLAPILTSTSSIPLNASDAYVAVDIIANSDARTLLGLSTIWLVKHFLPDIGLILDALNGHEEMFSAIIKGDALPDGRDCVQVLSCLGAIQRGDNPTSIGDEYYEKVPSYFFGGLKAGSKALRTAEHEMLAAGLLPSALIIKHELIKGYFRLTLLSKDRVSDLRQQNGVGEQEPLTDRQYEVLRGIFDLYKKVGRNRQRQAIECFIKQWDTFPTLRKVHNWWDALGYSVKLTKPGDAVALLAIAHRYRAN